MSFMSVVRSAALLITLVLSGMVWAGGATWIDVRTPEEFGQKHVPEAINIPYDQIGSKIAELGLDKDQVIYVYCHSGRRAGLAKETLDALGYSQVTNIGGVDDALIKAEQDAQK